MKKIIPNVNASRLSKLSATIAKRTTLLLLLFFLASCSVYEKDDWKILQEKDCLQDYFKFALVNPEYEKIDLIFDSITSKVRKNNTHIIYLTYRGTDQFEKIDQFWIEEFDPYEDPGHITYRNAFEIDISNPDTLYIEGQPGSYRGLDVQMDEFFNNPDDLDMYSEQEPFESELLGKVNMSRGMIGISGYNYREKNALSIPMSKYFEAYSYVEEYFIYRRDNLANEHFSKPYTVLSENEKSAINEISPIFIWFIF
jgi:hypothetical protein